MTCIISWKSGQTWAGEYIEEDNVSDCDLKLSDATIKAFTSVIFTALLKDDVQALMQVISSEPLMSYYKTYPEVLRLLSEQYSKPSSSVDSNPYYFIKRWCSGLHVSNISEASDVLLQDLSEGPEIIAQTVFKV